MAFGKKQPKTVSQITSGLQKMLDELEVSQAQFEEQERTNKEEIQKLEAQNQDITTELTRNEKIRGKFRELLGG